MTGVGKGWHEMCGVARSGEKKLGSCWFWILMLIDL